MTSVDRHVPAYPSPLVELIRFRSIFPPFAERHVPLLPEKIVSAFPVLPERNPYVENGVDSAKSGKKSLTFRKKVLYWYVAVEKQNCRDVAQPG